MNISHARIQIDMAVLLKETTYTYPYDISIYLKSSKKTRNDG